MSDLLTFDNLKVFASPLAAIGIALCSAIFAIVAYLLRTRQHVALRVESLPFIMPHNFKEAMDGPSDGSLRTLLRKTNYYEMLLTLTNVDYFYTIQITNNTKHSVEDCTINIPQGRGIVEFYRGNEKIVFGESERAVPIGTLRPKEIVNIKLFLLEPYRLL